MKARHAENHRGGLLVVRRASPGADRDKKSLSPRTGFFTCNVGTMTNAGMTVKHHYPYDHNMTLDANLQGVNEQLNDLEEYREEQQEAEYSGGMRR